MNRADAFEAIDRSLRILDPTSTPTERAKLGAEACMLALAHNAGAKAASLAAYEFADALATGDANAS